MEFNFDTIDEMYREANRYVLDCGDVLDSRAGRTKEVLGAHFRLSNPRDRIVRNPARKISKRFMLGEFLWIMSGRNDLEMVSHYNRRMKDYSDDQVTLHGAYGNRLRSWRGFDQIKIIIEKLKQNSNTRQAVMVIFDPEKDLVTATKDVPCNNLLQFILRNGRLNLFVYVRSQDLFLGFPYDVFHWTLLQELIANSLEVKLGNYFHTTGSLHLYETSWKQARMIADSENYVVEVMPRCDIKYEELSRLFEFEEASRGVKIKKLDSPTIFEQWAMKILCNK